MVRYFDVEEFSTERFLLYQGSVFGITRETLEFSNETDVFAMKIVMMKLSLKVAARVS